MKSTTRRKDCAVRLEGSPRVEPPLAERRERGKVEIKPRAEWRIHHRPRGDPPTRDPYRRKSASFMRPIKIAMPRKDLRLHTRRVHGQAPEIMVSIALDALYAQR